MKIKTAFAAALSIMGMLAAHAAYPDLLAVAKPNPEPALPAQWDTFTPPVAATAPAAGTPTLAEWTRTGAPNDTLVVTGDALSQAPSAGSDTQFLVYGQTTAANAVQASAVLQRWDGIKAVLTLPTSLPAWSTYFVWPGNSAGYGSPIAINRTEAWWVGPNAAAPGDTVSLYGRNLSHNGGTSAAWIYLKPSSGAGQWVTITSVNPFRVQFTVPAGLAAGTYELWAHNGHGGHYGWSGPQVLTIRNPHVWNGNVFNVRTYGAKGDGVADDTNAINAAYSAAQSYRDTSGLHPTIYFPTGIYLMRYGLGLSSDCRFLGDGRDQSILRCSAAFPQPAQPGDGYKLGLFWSTGGGQHDLEISDLALDAQGNYSATANGGSLLNATWTGASDVRISNVRITSLISGVGCASLPNVTRLVVVGCEFVGGELFLCRGDGNTVGACQFFNANYQERSIGELTVNHLSVTGCVAQDYGTVSPAGQGQGRLLGGSALFGAQGNVYVGDNTTINLGPQPGYNGGEQVLCEGSFAFYSGVAVSATATTLTFADLATDCTGQTAVIVKGKGLGQHRQITGYVAASHSITIDAAWNVVPDPTSEVVLLCSAYRWAVYHNHLTGKSFYATAYSAMAGVELYSGCFDWICDSNTTTSLRHGFYATSLLQTGAVTAVIPTFFNLFSNNTISSCYDGFYLNAQALANWSDSGIGLLGNICRNNTASQIATDGVMFTFGTSSPPAMPVPLFDVTVIEHNQFSNLGWGADLDSSNGGGATTNPILYQNSFALGSAPSAGSFGIRMNSAEKAVVSGNVVTGFEKSTIVTQP